MSDNPSEEEPSIEEILASIRQIISDDDVEEGAEKPVEAEPAPVEEPEVVEPEPEDDVLELTEEVVEPEEEPEPAPMIEEEIEVDMVDREEEPEPAYEPAPTIPSDIMSSTTQAATMGAMAKLASKMPINNGRSYDGVTLEDIVKEMLHPMLREWMDSNLPPMVERIVQKELEKLARRAADD